MEMGSEFTINVLCGFPGAGKSTYASRYLSNTIIISIDQIRCELGVGGSSVGNDKKRFGNLLEEEKVHEIYYNKIIDCCKNKQSCTLDNLHLTRKSREEIYSKVREYKPFIRIIYIEAPNNIESCIHRRMKELPSRFIVELKDIFDFPELDECDELVIYKQHENGDDETHILN